MANHLSLEGSPDLPEDARLEREAAELLLRSGKEVRSYRGVPRRGKPTGFKDLLATKRWMDAVDRWTADDATQVLEQVQNDAALKMLDLVSEGRIQSVDDIPEDLVLAQLLTAAADRRSPAARLAALKELSRLRESKKGKRSSNLDELVDEKLRELQEDEEARRDARRRVRGQGQGVKAPKVPGEMPSTPPLRKVE